MSGKVEYNEQELLLRLRDGDTLAFEELYNQYKIRLTANLLRIVKSSELVEDVLQDVFLGIWENRHHIDPERSIKPYLFQSVANKAKNIFRKAASEQKFRNYLLPHWKEDYNPIEQLLTQQNDKQLLDALLNKLSPQQCTVYTLCKLDGRSYKEIAKLLGISETTVNTHIRNSNQILRELAQKDLKLLWVVIGTFICSNGCVRLLFS
ncbi:RNA polymerase sigma-70 factor [Olivibacter ginsenosidimutans]|uniref:RNA polymerase sigma-70 factor n=1 Tax=Olivibacter ginsenosidimutans TaxID=1176537 RepID=A0ABP9ACQ1_9SPHI